MRVCQSRHKELLDARQKPSQPRPKKTNRLPLTDVWQEGLSESTREKILIALGSLATKTLTPSNKTLTPKKECSNEQ